MPAVVSRLLILTYLLNTKFKHIYLPPIHQKKLESGTQKGPQGQTEGQAFYPGRPLQSATPSPLISINKLVMFLTIVIVAQLPFNTIKILRHHATNIIIYCPAVGEINI
jgi:hypothetical protein